jgi:hypothetical protein
VVRYVVVHRFGDADLSPRDGPRECRSLRREAKKMARQMSGVIGEEMKVHRTYYGYMLWRTGEQVELHRVEPEEDESI